MKQKKHCMTATTITVGKPDTAHLIIHCFSVNFCDFFFNVKVMGCGFFVQMLSFLIQKTQPNSMKKSHLSGVVKDMKHNSHDFVYSFK